MPRKPMGAPRHLNTRGTNLRRSGELLATGGGSAPPTEARIPPAPLALETSADSNQSFISPETEPVKVCKKEINSRKGSEEDKLHTQTNEQPVPPPTPQEIEAALDVLKRAFDAVAHDPKATEALRRKVEVLGRPSGSSPPEWIKHKQKYPDSSPAQFVIDHYISQFGQEFSKASLRRDPLLYRDMANWLRTHDLPKDLAPHWITKKQLNDKQLAKIDGQITAKTVPDLGERTRLHNVTQARAQRDKRRSRQPAPH